MSLFLRKGTHVDSNGCNINAPISPAHLVRKSLYVGKPDQARIYTDIQHPCSLACGAVAALMPFFATCEAPSFCAQLVALLFGQFFGLCPLLVVTMPILTILLPTWAWHGLVPLVATTVGVMLLTLRLVWLRPSGAISKASPTASRDLSFESAFISPSLEVSFFSAHSILDHFI